MARTRLVRNAWTATLLLAARLVVGCGDGSAARSPAAPGVSDDAGADADDGSTPGPPFSLCNEGQSCAGANVDCVEGRCLPDCSSDADCPTGSKCAIATLGLNCDLVYHCSDPANDPCTPLPESCPAGLSCIVQPEWPDAPSLRSFCGMRATGAPPMRCGGDEECAEGTGCRGEFEGGAIGCEHWCRLGVPGDCPASATCVGFDPPIVLRGTTYGTCGTNCDPTQPCANGQSCAVVDWPGGVATDCIFGGPAGDGATACMPGPGPCTLLDAVCRSLPNGSSVCEPAGCGASRLACTTGTTCRIHAPGQTGCELVCDTAAAGACPAGSACVPFATPLVIRGVTYGTCEAACDPLSPLATCGPNATCAVVTDTPGGPSTACVSAGRGTGALGCLDGASDSCAPGDTCASFALGASSARACEPYCRVGHPEDCPAQLVPQTCAAIVPAVTVKGVQYGTCQDDCDLTDSTGTCGAAVYGFATDCIPVDDGVNPVHTACVGAPLGGGASGAACADASACGPDTTCQNHVCVPWCKLGAAGHCAPGTTCTATSPALTIAGVSYGVCL